MAYAPSPKRLKEIKNEFNIVKSYKYSNKISENASLFELICYIQHYSTGTRFIDFTTTSDVALYFACNENSDDDGALYLYTYAPHKVEWYTTFVITELVSIPSGKAISLQEFSVKVREAMQEKCPKLFEQFPTDEELNEVIISFLDHGFMVVPDEVTRKSNERIKRQDGCFFVCGAKFKKKLCSQDRYYSNAGRQYFYPHSAVIPDSLKNKGSLVKIVIDKGIKKDIISKLSEKGINSEYLFPLD